MFLIGIGIHINYVKELSEWCVYDFMEDQQSISPRQFGFTEKLTCVADPLRSLHQGSGYYSRERRFCKFYSPESVKKKS